MVEDGSWALKNILDGAGFRIGVAPFPRGPVKQVTLGTTDGFGIFAGTKHPEEAWEFLKFLISKDYGRAMAQAHFLQPARTSLVPEWAGYIRQEYPEATKDLNLEAFADGQIKEYSVTVEHFPNMVGVGKSPKMPGTRFILLAKRRSPRWRMCAERSKRSNSRPVGWRLHPAAVRQRVKSQRRVLTATQV